VICGYRRKIRPSENVPRMQNQQPSSACYVSLKLFSQAEYHLVFEEANSFRDMRWVFFDLSSKFFDFLF